MDEINTQNTAQSKPPRVPSNSRNRTVMLVVGVIFLFLIIAVTFPFLRDTVFKDLFQKDDSDATGRETANVREAACYVYVVDDPNSAADSIFYALDFEKQVATKMNTSDTQFAGKDFESLDVDPVTDILYSITQGSPSVLYQVDGSVDDFTGAQRIGAIASNDGCVQGDSDKKDDNDHDDSDNGESEDDDDSCNGSSTISNVEGIAFHPDGTMWAVVGQSGGDWKNTVITINQNNAVATRQYRISNEGDFESIAWARDPQDGVLKMYLSKGRKIYVLSDISEPESAKVALIEDLRGKIAGSEIEGLETNGNGNLLLGMHDVDSVALYEYVIGGDVTVLGDMKGENIKDVEGIAWTPICIVTEPTPTDIPVEPTVTPTQIVDAPSSCVGDRVIDDLNEDGVQNSGEPGISNIKVTLFDGFGIELKSTNTNDNGEYTFCDLPEGDYTVRFDLPSGKRFSTAFVGDDIGIDSDADEVTGKSSIFSLVSGENNYSIDALMYASSLPVPTPTDVPTGGTAPTPTTVAVAPTATPLPEVVGDAGQITPTPLPGKACIAGSVILDANSNGIQDSGEGGVSNIQVQLVADGNVVATTRSNADGDYSFCRVKSGVYQVQFDIPDEYVTSKRDQGSDDTIDCDPDPVRGLTDRFNFDASNGDDTTRDACVYTVGALPDTGVRENIYILLAIMVTSFALGTKLVHKR